MTPYMANDKMLSNLISYSTKSKHKRGVRSDTGSSSSDFAQVSFSKYVKDSTFWLSVKEMQYNRRNESIPEEFIPGIFQRDKLFCQKASISSPHLERKIESNKSCVQQMASPKIRQ